MRGFPATYLNNPNPHLAATYMANLNKAAAYAAAVSANRHHSLMTPVYHQNQAMATSHEDLTAEGRLRVQQQQTKANTADPYNQQNIYAVSALFSSIFQPLPSVLSYFSSLIFNSATCAFGKRVAISSPRILSNSASAHQSTAAHSGL